MATNYKYQGTDIAALTAKSKGEIGGGINPKNSDYKSNYSGIYNFIPYRSSGNWAAVQVEYANAYKSSSSNSVKLSNAAAWGTAPIPKRLGLNNTTSQYISTLTYALTPTETNPFPTYTLDKPGGCSCAVVDVVAKGGNGGAANSSTRDGGGGGGAGGQASLIINFDKTGAVTFKQNDNDLTITCANQSEKEIILDNGKNGGKGGETDLGKGAGGDGGSAPSSSSITGITIAWYKAGANGGTGSGAAGNTGGGTHGDDGGDAPSSMTFLNTSSTITSYSGGTGGIGNDNSSNGSFVWGGGGGGASIFGSGGDGGDVNKTAKAGGYGAGGGGAATSSVNTVGAGGAACIKVYYESNNSSSYTVSGGGSVGCVFPGTLIALDKETSVDIADFAGGTPIDFCNPDTLEHFPQQTMPRFFYRSATKKITVELEDGKTLSMTPNHVVLTKEGFKAYLDDYMYPKYDIGDELATIDGYKKIISIRDENIDPAMVYNIITENSLMVANGIIVAGELDYSVNVVAVDDGFEKVN